MNRLWGYPLAEQNSLRYTLQSMIAYKGVLSQTGVCSHWLAGS